MRSLPRQIAPCIVFVYVACFAAASSSFAERFVFPPGAKNGGVAIYTPQPSYPATALARRAHGVGVYVMRVEIKTGRVKSVGIVRSTGHSDLDAAAMQALAQWRFKPYVGLRSIKELFPHRKDPLREQDALVQTPMTFSL